MNLSATSSKTSPARALYVRQCRHLRAQPSSSRELAPDIALHNDTSLERCFPSCLRDFYNNSSSISYFLALLYLLSTSKFFVVFSSLLSCCFPQQSRGTLISDANFSPQMTWSSTADHVQAHVFGPIVVPNLMSILKYVKGS